MAADDRSAELLEAGERCGQHPRAARLAAFHPGRIAEFHEHPHLPCTAAPQRLGEAVTAPPPNPGDLGPFYLRCLPARLKQFRG